MNKLTCSAAKFFFDHYPKEMSLFLFGHSEVITTDMYNEYIEWCKTEEGREYLKGGKHYKPMNGEKE